MARPRKVLEGAVATPRTPDPVPGDNGEALARIAAWFKAEFPGEWDELHRGPFAYGIEQMIEIARGK